MVLYMFQDLGADDQVKRIGEPGSPDVQRMEFTRWKGYAIGIYHFLGNIYPNTTNVLAHATEGDEKFAIPATGIENRVVWVHPCKTRYQSSAVERGRGVLDHVSPLGPPAVIVGWMHMSPPRDQT
jgi:hypothetical protein